MCGCTARLFAQNVDAVLVVIVILAGEAIFVIFELEVYKTSKTKYFMILDKCFFPECIFFEVCRRQRRARAWAQAPPWAHMGPHWGLGWGHVTYRHWGVPLA